MGPSEITDQNTPFFLWRHSSTVHFPLSVSTTEWQESSGKKSELEWWGKSDRREGKGQKKVGHMQTERNRKQRTGSNWLHLHVVICQHWQELNGTNMHLPCPLGQFPWKRHFSPLHIYNIFIWLGSNSQYSACNLNGLYDIKIMQTQHGIIMWITILGATDLKDMDQQLVFFQGWDLEFTQLSCNSTILLSFYQPAVGL